MTSKKKMSRSLKRRGSMRKSLKHALSSRRSRKRRSGSHKRVKSKYRMQGMGTLLTMYGGATEALEEEFAKLRKEVAELRLQIEKLSAPKSKERSELVNKLHSVKRQMGNTKKKCKQS